MTAWLVVRRMNSQDRHLRRQRLWQVLSRSGREVLVPLNPDIPRFECELLVSDLLAIYQQCQSKLHVYSERKNGKQLYAQDARNILFTSALAASQPLLGE